MSAIKRWLDDELERISKDTGYSWDVLMDELIEMDFDLDGLRQKAANHCIGL